MSNFDTDLDRYLARVDLDMAEVEFWEATEPDWRDLSTDPEHRDTVSAWDIPASQQEDADDYK